MTVCNMGMACRYLGYHQASDLRFAVEQRMRSSWRSRRAWRLTDERCCASSSAGAFEPGSDAFREMVRLRLEVAAAVGAWGFNLVMCDVDTLWLRDPGDFFDTCAPTDISRFLPTIAALRRPCSAARPHAHCVSRKERVTGWREACGHVL